MNKYEKALKNFECELTQMYGCDEANMNLDITSIKELVERATPKKMINLDYHEELARCPMCYCIQPLSNNFCPNCGQAINQ